MLVGLVLTKGWQRGLAWRRGVGTKSTVGRAVRLSVWVKACEDLITMGSGRVTGTLLFFSGPFFGSFSLRPKWYGRKRPEDLGGAGRQSTGPIQRLAFG